MTTTSLIHHCQHFQNPSSLTLPLKLLTASCTLLITSLSWCVSSLSVHPHRCSAADNTPSSHVSIYFPHCDLQQHHSCHLLSLEQIPASYWSPRTKYCHLHCVLKIFLATPLIMTSLMSNWYCNLTFMIMCYAHLQLIFQPAKECNCLQRKQNDPSAYLYDSLICSLDTIMRSNSMNIVCVQSVQIKYFCIFIHLL